MKRSRKKKAQGTSDSGYAMGLGVGLILVMVVMLAQEHIAKYTPEGAPEKAIFYALIATFIVGIGLTPTAMNTTNKH